jgi:hypothetical protein
MNDKISSLVPTSKNNPSPSLFFLPYMFNNSFANSLSTIDTALHRSSSARDANHFRRFIVCVAFVVCELNISDRFAVVGDVGADLASVTSTEGDDKSAVGVTNNETELVRLFVFLLVLPLVMSFVLLKYSLSVFVEIVGSLVAELVS